MKRSLDLWRGGDFWNPTRDISSLHRGIDRLFEDMLAPLTGQAGEETWRFNAPAVDIEETDSHYVLSFDLPGIAKDDLKIEVVDNQLIVSGERKEDRREQKRSRHLHERYYGAFKRVFALPSTVDPGKVEAGYEDGVLRLAVPKSETAKPRQIKISESKGGFFDKLLGREKEKAIEEKPTKVA